MLAEIPLVGGFEAGRYSEVRSGMQEDSHEKDQVVALRAGNREVGR
jgi:hypothetical protein